MNSNIEKMIDDYIREQYAVACVESRELSSHPILNGNKKYGVKYYYPLKPLALIILRSEILLDYKCNEACMHRKRHAERGLASGVRPYRGRAGRKVNSDISCVS